MHFTVINCNIHTSKTEMMKKQDYKNKVTIKKAKLLKNFIFQLFSISVKPN